MNSVGSMSISEKKREKEESMADRATKAAIEGKALNATDMAIDSIRQGKKIDYADMVKASVIANYAAKELMKKEKKPETEPESTKKRTKKPKEKTATIYVGARVRFCIDPIFNKRDGTIIDIKERKRMDILIKVAGDDNQLYTIEPDAIREVLSGGNKNFTEKDVKKKLETIRFANAKRWNIALVLAIFFGLYGIDRFYLGYKKIGLLKLLTLGGLGVLWFYDLYCIATKSRFAAKIEWK